MGEGNAKEAGKLTDLIQEAAGKSVEIVEQRRGAIEDCEELHQITVSTLQRCWSGMRTMNSNVKPSGVTTKAPPKASPPQLNIPTDAEPSGVTTDAPPETSPHHPKIPTDSLQ
ncbi:hypothetical protein NE237_003242 [Protea cynaroides]|uniref:Uncharacterized protein n=1 Tax=Protea cynaroides TaxID=273540 RepID=A0A9Q0KGC8_9MAGN|nr:hypothetical protein NE237_003242 [Protea cynaroides]